MYNLCVEKHSLGNRSLSWHLAYDIHSYGPCGKVAVVTDNPLALLSATRKQWMRLIRQMQNQRSSTLDRARIDALQQQVTWMQGLSFSSKAPDDLLEADTTFATADDFVRVPPACRCIYVNYTFDREKLYMMTSWMPRDALVVIYE